MQGKNKILIFLFFLVMPSSILSAQLPGCAEIRKRISETKAPTPLDREQYLAEFIGYEKQLSAGNQHNDSCRVILLDHISKLFLSKKDYSQSIAYLNKAINIIDRNFHSTAIDPIFQIRNYYNLAAVYDSMKRSTEMLRSYDSCVSVAQRLSVVNVYLLYALRQSVEYRYSVGDYDLCITQAELGEKLSGRYIVPESLKGYGDSASYSIQFFIQKINALEVSNKGGSETQGLIQYKIKQCTKAKLKQYLGVLYEQLGLSMMHERKHDQVLKYFMLAKDNYRTQNLLVNYKGIVHNIGYLYDTVYKKYARALYYYRQALAIKIHDSRNSKLDSINTLNIYSNIGSVYARNFQFDSAQYFFKCAFNLIQKGADETATLFSSVDDFIRNQKVEYLTGLYINKGDAFYKQYLVTQNKDQLKEAIRLFKLTDQLLERIKSNQFEIQSKLFWRKITHPFYEQAIEASIRSANVEDAFYFFERSRAILLFDQMKEQRGFSETYILQQQQLGTKISAAQEQLEVMLPGSAEFRSLQNKIADYRDSQNYLLRRIKVESPLYFSNFLDSGFISLHDTRRKILKDRTLVELFNGDSSVYSMVVTSKDIYFSRINKREFDAAIGQCISYISNPAFANNKTMFRSFVKNSASLYKIIFGDRLLADGPVIFAMDGHHVPLETLVIKTVAGNPVYFIENHAVSYTYSARYLMSQFSRDPSFKPGEFLGVAPVHFPRKYRQLTALPGSDNAVRQAASLFTDSDTLLNDQATRNSFLKKFGQYRIVQLFSHSSDSSSNHDEPVIYFADEALYLSELSNIATPATKLVVLSACETGNGEFYAGEGVFSFNRAFAALGIPACINNLWSVDNESTYELTRLFYKKIAEGLPVDEALRAAKLVFINSPSNKKKMPYFWAATVLAGKADAIEFKKRSELDMVTTITMASIVIVVTISLLIVSTVRFRKR